MRLPVLTLALILGAALPAALAGEETGSEEQTAPAAGSRASRYAEADQALREARLASSNAGAAQARISRISDILERFPDYPKRGMLRYFLGVNYQLLSNYQQAVKAFETALQEQPDLEVRTSIGSYLESARRRVFASRTSKVLMGVLIAALLLAMVMLLRAEASSLRWRRLLFPFGLALLVWGVLVLVLPPLMGPATAGLSSYPQPVLAGFRLGQLGDDSLRALLGYGAFAIVATLPAAAAASLLKRSWLRPVLGITGMVVICGSIMGLYLMRYCWGQSRYHPGSARLIFHVRDIATKKEVPEQMLPLFDPEFRKRIIEERGESGRGRPASEE